MLLRRGFLLFLVGLALTVPSSSGKAAAPPVRARTDAHGDALPPGAIARLGTTRLRHVGHVGAVAFSPDGKTLASGGSEHVRLWHPDTGKELRRWRMPGWVSALAFSRDGKVLAVGLRHAGVVLLDPSSGRELDRFGQLWRDTVALAFAPDGKTLAVGCAATVVFWDVATGTKIRHLEDYLHEMRAVAFAPSGKTLAVACDHGVTLWAPATGELIRTVTKKRALSVAFSPDGARLATTDEEGGVVLWAADTGQELRHFPRLHGTASCVAFSPDGKTVASGGSIRNSICLTNTQTGRHHRISAGRRQEGIRALAFAPDGKRLASGGEDQRVRLWNVRSWEELKFLSEGPEGVLVGLSANGKVTATLGGERTVRLWETATGRLLRQMRNADWRSCLALSPDGELVAFRDEEQRIVLHKAATGRLLRRCGEQPSWGPWATFSADGKLLATGGDKAARMWDVTTGEQRQRLEGHTAEVVAGAFSPDGKVLATGSMDGTVRFWSVATGKELHQLTAHGGLPATSVAFSGDGKLLASAGENSFLCLWDTTTYRRVSRFVKKGHRSSFLAFSRDGKVIASDEEKALCLWDVKSGKKVGTFSGHEGEINSAAFGPDGKTLVTGSHDGTALVWDLTARPPAPVRPVRAVSLDRCGDALPAGATGRLGALRFRFGSQVAGVAYAPDGKTMAVGTGGNEGSELLLLEARTGKVLRRFEGYRGWVSRVAFSPDGKVLAMAAGNEVYLWSPASGAKLDHFRGHTEGTTHDLAFSPDGKVLAVSGLASDKSKDHPILLWDVPAGRQLRRLAGHTKTASVLAFSRDGKVLASASGAEVKFWDGKTGKLVRTFAVGGTVLAFAPDLKALLFATRDKTIGVWDVERGKEARRIRARSDSCRLAPDGKTLAAVERGGVLALWDASTGKFLRHLDGPEGGGALPVGFSPDSKTLITRRGWAETDYGLRLWDVSTGRERRPNEGHGGAVSCLALTPDGNSVVSGSADQTVRVWEAKTGKELLRYTGHEAAVEAVAISPDGHTVASGDDGGAIDLWERTTGKRWHSLVARRRRRGNRAVAALVFSADGKRLIAGTRDGTIWAWDMSTGRRLREIEASEYGGGEAALAPDGRTLAFVGIAVGAEDGRRRAEKGVLAFWDLETGKEVGRIVGKEGESFWSVAFSADGKFLAASRSVFSGRRHSGEHQIVLFEVLTRQELLRIDTATRVEAMVFSPDGRSLITGGGGRRGGDRTVRVWDVLVGKEIASLSGHASRVLSLALSPDDQTLVSGSADGTALLWRRNWPRGWRPWQDVRLSRKQQQEQWAHLASRDAAQAYRAIRKLADVPEQAVALLGERLRPAAPGASARVIARMIADLDSDDFEVREKAREGLEKEGEWAEPALRRALADRPSLEVRRRIERLLALLEGGPPSSPRMQMLRAIAVLERLSTPEARRLLEKLARGAAGAVLTREAKEALRRMDRAMARGRT
jgi:WD40 repeat protein